MSPFLYLSRPTHLFANLVDKNLKFNDEVDIKYIYTHLKKPEYDKHPNLECIVCPCTGIKHLEPIPDNVKVICLNNRNFLYQNVWSTSEWALSTMLYLLRQQGEEIYNKKIGIIGAGRVGKQLSQLLSGFKVNIIYHDLNKKFIPMDLGPIVNLTFILRHSDIITVHLAENEDTKDYLGKEEFDYINKKGIRPFVINSSRSSIVNGTAMVDAFEKDGISGFGVDVIEDYSVQIKSEIYRLSCVQPERVYMTEHIAGKGRLSRELTDRFVYDEFVKWLGGE